MGHQTTKFSYIVFSSCISQPKKQTSLSEHKWKEKFTISVLAAQSNSNPGFWYIPKKQYIFYTASVDARNYSSPPFHIYPPSAKETVQTKEMGENRRILLGRTVLDQEQRQQWSYGLSRRALLWFYHCSISEHNDDFSPWRTNTRRSWKKGLCGD